MSRPENKTWGIGNHKLKFTAYAKTGGTTFGEEKKKISTTVARVEPNKAIELFRNKINFRTKKNTFDATHMDEIIKSEFSKSKMDMRMVSNIKKKPKYQRPKEDSIRKFRFNDVGKIHLEINDRPSASFLTPTRNKVLISSYVDEADCPSILMPDESMTVDISRDKNNIINESK